MEQYYDSIIVGGGYAGLSAAMWLGRYHRSVAVISEGPVRNATSTVMHGYPGMDGQSPLELLKQIETEAAKYGVVFVDGWAEEAYKSNGGFMVKTGSGSYQAKCLLVATGTEDVQPLDIPGFSRFHGHTAWHCPACDGHEYTDKRIAIIGWHKDIVSYAKEFLAYTSSGKITVYAHGHGDRLNQKIRQHAQASGLQIIDEPIAELQGDGGRLRQILLTNGKTVAADGLFYNIAQKPRLSLLEQLGCELTDGAVKTDNQQQTTVRGVFAAGDIVPSEDFVVVACSTGAVAASSIHENLQET